ncbi:hypothetical protein Pelo_6823 [Pelomyxa schiedti]|nr:hypothetical protein Pelo_6823 [Pelomyxa schiedti]
MATTTKPQIGPYEWFEAASDGNIDALQRKLGSYIDILNSINHEEQRVTALHAATWSGQARCVEFLLSLHADANCQIVRYTIQIIFTLPFPLKT